MRKFHISILLMLLVEVCSAAESIVIPGGALHVTVPDGWAALPTAGTQVLIRGPGKDPVLAPRLAVTFSPAEPAAAAASVRDGLLRVADGCEVIDEDQVPLGGRVWRRTRLRFAAGPLVFSQVIWVGAIDGRTVVAVLSAGEDQLPAHLATGASVVAGLKQ